MAIAGVGFLLYIKPITMTEDQFMQAQQTMTMNYAQVFGTLTETSIALINACRYVGKDEQGEYVWTATSYDECGNVTFVKEYKPA